MTRPFNDPLLKATRTLLRAIYGLLAGLAALFAVLSVIAAIALVLGYHWPMSELPNATADPVRDTVLVAVQAPILALFAWFVRVLDQIVATVAGGDPFVGINADRLTRMAWLMVALVVVHAGLVPLLHALFADVVANPFQYPNPSLLFPLTLFILARVFRQGAEMRDDLAGTV